MGLELDKYFETIKRIDWHIQHRATGTPEQLASKLKISKRHLQRYLHLMVNYLGCPILYDRTAQTYYYDGVGKLVIKWKSVH